MKAQMKAMTPEQVKATLIKAAAKANREELAYRKKYKWYREGTEFTPKRPKDVAPCYKARSGVFQGANWSFNPQTMYADSYRWWPMLKIIKGVLVRNVHNYSMSTTRHQKTLNRCMASLGIKADLTVSVRSSLNNLGFVKRELLETWARAAIKNKYSRKPIKGILPELKDMADVSLIGIHFSKKAMKEALESAEKARRERLSWAREKRQKALATRVPVAVRPMLTLIDGGLT